MSQATNRKFYDLDKIKQIPILDICNAFGVVVEPKGGKIWCKLRPERTASVILHPENNTYHDFGTSETGDTIGLVSAFFNVDRGAAINMIAETFQVLPENTRGGLKPEDLSLWEYEKIGLDGKMSTRNFDFDLSRQSVERVTELSLRYGMPMNVLKKNNPRIYERLIKQRAIPHVRDLRNEYYMEVFSKYNLAKAVGSEQVFNHSVENGEFNDMIKELQTAERILERACKGTQITAWPVGNYEPMADIQKILNGEVKLALGTASYMELQSLSKKENSPVKYCTVDMNSFLRGNTGLNAFTHSAFIKDNKVVVGYLEKDYVGIKPLLDKIRVPAKGSLNQQIAQAQQQSAQRSSDSYQKAPQAQKNFKGEER